MNNNPFKPSDINTVDSSNPQCICFCIDKKTITDKIAKYVSELINKNIAYAELITYDNGEMKKNKEFLSFSAEITLGKSANTEPSLMYDALRRAILDFRIFKKDQQATKKPVPQKCTVIFISNGSHKADEEQEIIDVVQQNQRFFDYMCIHTENNTDGILNRMFEENSVFNGTRNDYIQEIIKKITDKLIEISTSAAGTYEALSSINWEKHLRSNQEGDK